MSEQQLRTEAQARRLALFLESALRGDDGWWLPRDKMVHRIRQAVTEGSLTGLRFLRGVAQAAGLVFVDYAVWLLVADLLEAGAPSGVLDEPATEPLPETGGPRGDTQALGRAWTAADEIAAHQAWLDAQEDK